MSDAMGLMAPAAISQQYLEHQAYMDCSNETSALVDKEVQAILNACYADAKNILIANRGLLEEISEYLLAKETITGEELMAYVNADKKPAEETGEDISE